MYGKRIKELRIEKNLTQLELAKIIGVKQSFISMWEHENIEPNIDNIIKLANFFEVCTDYLLGRQNWY